MIVGYFGCFGPMTGLRTYSIARYAFGIWGIRAIIVIGVCGAIGWASVNCELLPEDPANREHADEM